MPEPTPTVIPKKALEAARKQAARICHLAQSLYGARKIKTWRDLESQTGIIVGDYDVKPEALDVNIPYSFVLNAFLDKYQKDTENRLRRALNTQTKKVRLRLTPKDQCYRFSRPEQAIADSHTLNKDPILALYPEQDPAVREIVRRFWEVPESEQAIHLLCNGGTGSGKTPIGCAVIDIALVKDYLTPIFPLPFRVIWFTVKNAVEQTKRSLMRCGLGEYLTNGWIQVLPYSAMTSSQGIGTLIDIETIEDPFDPDSPPRIEYRWRDMAIGKLFIFDESHSLAKNTSKRFQAAKAAFLKAVEPHIKPLFNTKFLSLSATPFERVNDAEFFVSTADIKFNGTPISFANFNTALASVIAPSGPHLPNKDSAAKLFNIISPRLVEIPYVEWDYKSINAVRFYGFLTAEDKAFADAAMDRYLEKIAKLGKNTPSERALKYIYLLQMRKEVEPIRSIQVITDMHGDVQAGYSPVMASQFTGAIIKSVFYALDVLGYQRHELSIVWGGRENIQPDKILSAQDLIDLTTAAIESGNGIDATTRRLIQKNLAWQEDRLLFGDVSAAEQDARYGRLKSLGLVGIQTQARRQEEIDRFMSGEAKMCFFTAQSGGTGLSLEHADARTKPRKLYATPIYSGKEFTQVLGRCPRRNSISHTYQFVCLMRGTVEEKHVAPILDIKLQCLGEIGSRKTDITEILASLSAEELRSEIHTTFQKVRDLEEAEQQALTDENTQIHANDSDDSDTDTDSSDTDTDNEQE